MCNLIGVDRGALTMAKNVLERAGKYEVKDALINSAVPLEELLKRVATEHPKLYMLFVTGQMMRDYT